MNRRDRIAAEDLLRDYRLQLRLAGDNRSLGQPHDPAEAMETANRMLTKVNAIMRMLLPDTEPISGSSVSDHEAGLDRVLRVEDILGDWDEMAEDDGETVQFGMPLNALDVVVLEAARQDWYHGKWRDAVANAAAKLNRFTQDRLGRYDISDSALMAEAFSPEDPKVGKPRLRCPGNFDSETIKSMQNGAHLLAMGTMKAIRNPAVHWTGNGNPVSAGEQLAVLSVIARWVRYWNVVQYTPTV